MKRRHPLIGISAIITMAFLYLPLLGVAVFSVNSARRGLVWHGFTLDWYLKLLENEYILEAAWNTLVLAIVSTIIAVILGSILAVGLDRFPWSKRTNCRLGCSNLYPGDNTGYHTGRRPGHCIRSA